MDISPREYRLDYEYKAVKKYKHKPTEISNITILGEPRNFPLVIIENSAILTFLRENDGVVYYSQTGAIK